MATTKRSPMTVRGAQRLREELDHLKSVQRPKVIEAIAEARAHGDLKENAEYHAAREQQGFIEGRIKQLEAELSQAQIDAVQAWPASPLFDARARDVLAYADAMTLQVQVPQPLFDAVRAHFDARELVELTATVAAYNMVSRFLEALQIDIET